MQQNVGCPVFEYTILEPEAEETPTTLQERMNKLAADGWTISSVIPPAHIEPGSVTPTTIIMARQVGIRLIAIELGILAAGSVMAS